MSTFTNFDLDENILPEYLYFYIINRNTNEIISACERDSCLFSQVYNLDLKLKRAGIINSKHLNGPFHKLKWTPYKGNNIIGFEQLVKLNEYRIRYWYTSHLNWFISTVLTIYKKHVKSIHFLSNNKYYPSNNLVVNKIFKYVNEPIQQKYGSIIKGVNNLNKSDYINWLRFYSIFVCHNN